LPAGNKESPAHYCGRPTIQQSRYPINNTHIIITRRAGLLFQPVINRCFVNEAAFYDGIASGFSCCNVITG